MPSSRVTFLIPAIEMMRSPNRRAAGEGDFGHPRVGDQPFAYNFAGAIDQVDRAGWKAGLHQDLAEFNSGDGRRCWRV